MTAIGFVASAVTMVILAGDVAPSRVYLGTDTRAAALFVGALVALNPVHRRLRALSTFRPQRAERIVLGIGVVLAVSWAIGGDHLDLLLHGGLLVHSTLAALGHRPDRRRRARRHAPQAISHARGSPGSAAGRTASTSGTGP